MEQHVQYCTTADGIRIAYAVTGGGPPFVWVPGWVSHLEMEWDSPGRRAAFEFISSRVTYIRHDKRGNGLSSRNVADYSTEASVRDLETLVDHLGLERFAIGGQSEGTPIALMYASRHPERVTKLALYGSFARGDGLFGSPEVRDAVRQIVRTQWGVATKLMSAILLGEDAYMPAEEFAAYQVAGVSSVEALTMLDRAIGMDVHHLLADITGPTLVFHHRDDMAVPIELGQEVAASIRTARFLSGPGGHVASPQAAVAFLRAMVSFLVDEDIGDVDPFREDDPNRPVSAVDSTRVVEPTASALYSDGSLTIDTEQHLVARDGDALELSPTEFRLLVELAKAPGRVHLYDELLHRVWGAEYVGETEFLHVYVSRLRRKLGREVISTERGFGYRFMGNRSGQ